MSHSIMRNRTSETRRGRTGWIRICVAILTLCGFATPAVSESDIAGKRLLMSCTQDVTQDWSAHSNHFWHREHGVDYAFELTLADADLTISSVTEPDPGSGLWPELVFREGIPGNGVEMTLSLNDRATETMSGGLQVPVLADIARAADMISIRTTGGPVAFAMEAVPSIGPQRVLANVDGLDVYFRCLDGFMLVD